MEDNNIYTLAMFMDKNFTKPQKIKITVLVYHYVKMEVMAVKDELSNFDRQTGFQNILYRNMVLEVCQCLDKYLVQTNYKKIHEPFDIILPFLFCLYLLDILSVEGKWYCTDIRIIRGRLDGIIAKNEFAKIFSTPYQLLAQLEPSLTEYPEVRKIGEINLLVKFQSEIKTLSEQNG